MFDLFKKKKKELKIPAPPSAENLPSFPSPKDLEKPSPEEMEKAVEETSPIEEHREKMTKRAQTDLAETREHEVTKPIFIHAPTYKSLIDEIGQMKAQMKEGDEIVETLESFKEDQDRIFKNWQSIVKDIHEKLIYVDETLFKR